MRVLLLVRESPCQRYCANTLFRQGMLTDVIVEEGSSRGNRSLLQRAAAKGRLLSRPGNAFWSVWNYWHESQYYGHQEEFDRKVLGAGHTAFDAGLNVIRTPDINADLVRQYIQDHPPALIFVFGTRIIKPWIFDMAPVPVVNMHWGWSPDFRGEGIITALAMKGIDALGVTVHRLSSVPDGGEILQRRRPAVDRDDNFYSIGLKSALTGTKIFSEVYSEFLTSGRLKGFPQDLQQGAFYSVQYMRENPQLKFLAWKNLKWQKSPAL